MRFKRVVVKIGSGVVTSGAVDSLEVDRNAIFRLADELSQLFHGGIEVIVVSSGAVALGVEELGLAKRPDELPDVQAMAAVGQGLLMQLWREAFGRHRLCVGQVLLTHEDLSDRQRFLNVRATLDSLLQRKVIPVVNENDTVATQEITVGDNDQLACQVAKMLGGDLLVLLTTVEGLLDNNGMLVSEVGPGDRPEQFVSYKTSGVGRGGMGTKLQAAAAATHGGIEVFIGDGRRHGIVQSAVNGESVGTRFQCATRGLPSRKHWIAYTLKPTGTLTLDKGASLAVKNTGASILPVGIASVTGDFESGDSVRIVDYEGNEIARGLVRHSAHDLSGLMGTKGAPAVHRDDLVMR